MSGSCDSPTSLYSNRLPSYEGRAWFVWPEATLNNATLKKHYLGALESNKALMRKAVAETIIADQNTTENSTENRPKHD
jgi:hypothetical protein